MDVHALTVKAVRDGPVCTVILRGDLDLAETDGFLEQAALAVDDRTERLVFDLAGVRFLDCAGVRALSIAARLAPSGCPVIICSLSPMGHRLAELLDLDLANLGDSAHAGDAQMGYGMGRLVTRNWPRRIRAPRSSPGPRDARDHRVQRTRLPVPGVIDTPTTDSGGGYTHFHPHLGTVIPPGEDSDDDAAPCRGRTAKRTMP